MFDPRGVRYDGESDRQKEVRLEATTFSFGPCETDIVISDEVVHKIAFFGPEKVSRVVSVNDVFAL